ncbi:MAG TPA: hypothetical protein VHO23_02765 [Candidatus Paceibacterota bacterium]|nr:hypothetical protein [Candidatus Paceibacterota bacterium]
MRWVILAFVIAVLGVVAFFLVPNEAAAPHESAEVPAAPAQMQGDPGTAAEAYVRANIGQLSPTPPVLGGTFYVTEIEAENGAGTVAYEDGHVAFTADFAYALTDKGISISSFVIRP